MLPTNAQLLSEQAAVIATLQPSPATTIRRKSITPIPVTIVTTVAGPSDAAPAAESTPPSVGLLDPKSSSLSRRPKGPLLTVRNALTDGDEEEDAGFYSDGGIYKSSERNDPDARSVNGDTGGLTHRTLASRSSKHKLRHNLLRQQHQSGDFSVSNPPFHEEEEDNDEAPPPRSSTEVSYFDGINTYASDGGGLSRSATSASSMRSVSGSTKGLEKTMHKTFAAHGLPSTERLIHVFICAIPRSKILQQGQMFITENFVCFHSNIFGFQTTYILHSSEILAVDPARTAMVIPNAIMVTTKDGSEFFFTSFVQREKALIAMRELIGIKTRPRASSFFEEESGRNSLSSGAGNADASKRGRSGKKSKRQDLSLPRAYGSDGDGGSHSFVPSSTTNPSTSSELSEEEHRSSRQAYLLPNQIQPLSGIKQRGLYHYRHHSRSPSVAGNRSDEGPLRTGSGNSAAGRPQLSQLRVSRRSSTNTNPNVSPPPSPVMSPLSVITPSAPAPAQTSLPFPLNYLAYSLELIGGALVSLTSQPSLTVRGEMIASPTLSPTQHLHPLNPQRKSSSRRVGSVSPSPASTYQAALLNNSISQTSLRSLHSIGSLRRQSRGQPFFETAVGATEGTARGVALGAVLAGLLVLLCFVLTLGNSLVLWRVRGIIRVLEEVTVSAVSARESGVEGLVQAALGGAVKVAAEFAEAI
ncbi:hypothetical protein HDU67_007037 [Dinochytrium kinnereticum]|nr:hypothetical protein HDU67_007037 [Dinochytrium kinnereticum]